MKIRLKHRLFFRQARNTVVVACVLGMILTLIQISYDWFRERRQVDDTITAMIGMLRESAIQAVYELDRDLAERVVKGLFEYHPIRIAQVVEGEQNVLAQLERPAVIGQFQWLVIRLFEKEKEYRLPLIYASNQRQLGYLTVSVDSQLIAANFFSRVRLTLINDVIRYIALSTVILFTFYVSLARPLLEMVQRLSDVDILKPAEARLPIPHSHAHDELGLLMTTINLLLERLNETLKNHQMAQRDLESHRDHLEQVVAQRTQELRHLVEELEHAKASAENANQAKSRFLANMSHELRTPLNAILGFSQLMMRGTNLLPDQQEDLETIKRSGEHLLILINDVLDLSKIEAGRMTLNPTNFDLYRLLADVEDMFRLRAQEKHLHLLIEREAHLPQYICADEGRLRQVLLNLLSNAIKFTTEGGVVVRVSSIDNCQLTINNCQLQFEVEDSGPGIAPDEVAMLFDAFTQTRTGQKAAEGTGLGLTISRKFVQLMGGDLQVSATVGTGSIFRFDLHVALATHSDLAITPPTRRVLALAPGQPRYRILVVDDRLTNRQLLVKLLHPLGFDVREAVNGQEAVTIWEQWEPHLIWMDMRMPVMDGYEATSRIKATVKGQATAIIAVTASTFEQERAIMLSSGCNDVVRKPFREQEIFDMMAKHLGVRYIEEDAAPDGTPQVRQASQAEIEALLTPDAFAALPAPLISDLEQALIRINPDEIAAILEQIRPHHADLARVIARVVENFEYHRILSVLQAAGGAHE